MNPHHCSRALALGALLALVRPGAALAVERGCPGVMIDADSDFRARFPDLLEQLQLQLAARSDLDPCARVDVRAEGDAVVTLTVTLPDGRAASRSVTRRDDIIPTLQALLLVPARTSAALAAAPATAPPPTTAPTPLPSRRLRLRANPDRLDDDAPPVAPPARTLGVELSVLTGARMGDGQVGVGAGMLGFLEVHGWLLGFEGRADVYRPLLSGGDPETALELALLAGRRFDFGGVALDLSAGPAVAMKGLAFSQSRSMQVVSMGPNSAPPPRPPPESDPNSGPVPRLLLGARFGFSPRSVFRTFIGVDGALGPRRVDDNAENASARLPAFSLGLSLGATVGTP
jgi:hypothetical protein